MRHVLQWLIALSIFGATEAFAQEPNASNIETPAKAAPSQEIPAIPAYTPRAAPAGQWVFTAQYGWIWMPYAERYVYLAISGDAYMYVYYPVAGWRWVVAPWVVGFGPTPYWGPWGMTRYYWYSHPWPRHGKYYGAHPWMHRDRWYYRKALPYRGHDRRIDVPRGAGKSRGGGHRHHR